MSYKSKDRIKMNPEIPSDTLKQALLNVLGRGTWTVDEMGETDDGVWVRGTKGNKVICLRDWIIPEAETKLEVTSNDLMELLDE